MSRSIDDFNPELEKEPQMLAQLIPASPATPETLYAHPGNNVLVEITAWTVTNHNAQDVDIKVYFDNDGTTYGNAELIFTGVVAKAESSPAGGLKILMSNPLGSIGFESDDVDCTVTIWGIIKPQR